MTDVDGLTWKTTVETLGKFGSSCVWQTSIGAVCCLVLPGFDVGERNLALTMSLALSVPCLEASFTLQGCVVRWVPVRFSGRYMAESVQSP